MERRKAVSLAAIFGLISGTVCTLYFVFLDQLGVHNPFGQYRYLYLSFYALAFVALFKIFRDRNQYRFLPKNGLFLGFLHLSIAASSATILLYGWLSSFGTHVVKNYRDASLQLLEKAKEFMQDELGEDAYEVTKTNIEALTASDIATDQAVSMIIWGVVFSLLFMLIFKHS